MSRADKVTRSVFAAVLGTAALVAGCTASDPAAPPATAAASPPAGQVNPNLRDAYLRTDEYLKGCTRQHGYDPKNTQRLGPNQLGPNELQWRNCAYDGIRTIIVPATKNPGLYTALIQKDQAMTEQIAAGSLTRAERRRRLDADIAQIRTQERGDFMEMRPGTPTTVTRSTELQRQSMYVINNTMGALR